MKKICISIIILCSALLTIQSQTLDIDGVSYAVDTLENHQVGPGTQYVSIRLTAPSKRMDVFFLKTDLKNPNIEIRTALGRDSIYSGEQPSAVAKRKSTEGAFYFAGTNGDFYSTTGPYTGYAVSGGMVEKEITKIPGDRNVFAMDEQKIPDIGIMSYEGNVQFASETWSINSVNHLRNENQLVLFNQYNGKYTRTNQYGTEVLIELEEGYDWGSNKTIKAKILKIEKGVGNMAIPPGKVVLSGHGLAADELDKLSENDEIDIRLNLSLNSNNTSNYVLMTGGDNYATMLLNGAVEQSSVWNELHPRTGLGYSQSKDTLIFCVVDGRGLSIGATTKQLAQLMKSAGAYTAFNMDGGGSSAMYIAEYGAPVNKTSDGTERAVANSIFVVSTAPTDDKISTIKPYKSSLLLPKYGEYTPQFYAYNQYGVLLNSDLQGVVLSCPETLGTIIGNKFIATGYTQGDITATYNGNIITTIAVRFLPVSEIKIRLDSVIVDNRTNYPIEVVATTSAGEITISPDALIWSVDNSEICKVENGSVKALSNGVAKVTGQIDDVTDIIQINVEIPAAPTIIGDSLHIDKWTMSTSSFLNATLDENNLPQDWDHGAAVNFTHSTGRSPFVKLINQTSLYGLPDTIKIVLNVGDMSISRAIVSLKSNNTTATTSTEFNSFQQNKDFSLDIPIDKLFDAKDRAIYPVWFDNVNFYLNASGMTSGQAYTLAIKDILLVYNGYISTKISALKTNSFYIYPNPTANQILNLQLKDNSAQQIRAEIYNLSGQKIIEKQYGVYSGGVIPISVKNVVPGIYILKVYEDEKCNTAKFVVK